MKGWHKMVEMLPLKVYLSPLYRGSMAVTDFLNFSLYMMSSFKVFNRINTVVYLFMYQTYNDISRLGHNHKQFSPYVEQISDRLKRFHTRKSLPHNHFSFFFKSPVNMIFVHSHPPPTIKYLPLYNLHLQNLKQYFKQATSC